MNAEPQKSEQHQDGEGASGTRTASPAKQQAFTAFDSKLALTVHLMEQVCDPAEPFARIPAIAFQ